MSNYIEKLKNDKSKDVVRKLFFILLGNLFCAVAFNVFFVPNRLLSGGIGGIGILIQYLTGMPAGIMVFILNVPIFLIGIRLVDREFAVFGFISMLVFSFLLTVTKDINQYLAVKDILLGAIFGGIFNGIGMGLMFRHRTCQGGFDIIAAVLKSKYNINIGSGLMAANTIVISFSSLLFGYKSAMYTLISMYIGYRILDKVQTGLNVRKKIIIISNKSEELADAILKQLNRGVTFLEGSGAYTKEGKKVIYCVVTSRETVKLKHIIDEIDPKAFFIASDVVEVRGKGFKNTGI